MVFFRTSDTKRDQAVLRGARTQRRQQQQTQQQMLTRQAETAGDTAGRPS